MKVDWIYINPSYPGTNTQARRIHDKLYNAVFPRSWWRRLWHALRRMAARTKR